MAFLKFFGNGNGHKKLTKEQEEKLQLLIRNTVRPCWLRGMKTQDEELLRQKIENS
jgi:hypothetical protein